MKLYNVRVEHFDGSVARMDGMSISDVHAIVDTLENLDQPIVRITEAGSYGTGTVAPL